MNDLVRQMLEVSSQIELDKQAIHHLDFEYNVERN